MDFENHFLKSDRAAAELRFNLIITSLKLIDSYTSSGDDEGAARTTDELTNALSDLYELACRKESGPDMYLHHLLTQPQGWYPA